MTDRPILFSGPMVCSLIGGRKTMTRRLAWRWPSSFGDARPIVGTVEECGIPTRWTRAAVGDRLWVRERTICTAVSKDGHQIKVGYDVDGVRPQAWFPRPERIKAVEVGRHLAMGCYREVSRLTLVLTAKKIERLQDITEEEAQAEGAFPEFEIDLATFVSGRPLPPSTYRLGFKHTWNLLHGDKAWDANPEVVAMTVIVHRQNIDALPIAA